MNLYIVLIPLELYRITVNSKVSWEDWINKIVLADRHYSQNLIKR
jgi:hypothetical protein